MLTNTVVKNSFPLFLMTLLVTSQLSGIKSVKASEETRCCPCGDGLGWFRDLAAMVIIVSRLQQPRAFASKFGDLGNYIKPSPVQKAGTASAGFRPKHWYVAEMAGKAYNYAARDKRCCPCRSKRDFRD